MAARRSVVTLASAPAHPPRRRSKRAPRPQSRRPRIPPRLLPSPEVRRDTTRKWIANRSEDRVNRPSYLTNGVAFLLKTP